ncbi:MAG TPA: substrate-binding domain-containing protein [Bacteroidia bacterium]|jgi:phosphate transport system substrate-binding protein|nr:substrate-binding domain-containing protein [Bacteroidia bacterium]
MKNKISSFYLFFPALFFFACNQSDNPKDMPNTPTSGVLKVFCEEGFRVPMKNQAATFLEIYSNSQIDVSYVNEVQAIEGLFNDSCKVILLSRNLSEAEMKKFAAKNLFPKQVCVAKSALAFIVPAGTSDSVFSIEKLKSFLSGADTSYRIVFDNENSGATRYLKDSLLPGNSFGKNCFAAKNTEELIKMVAAGNKLIGVIDYAWISDKDETITKEILTKVKALAVSKQEGTVGYFPDQSNIETRDYPFCRYMYIMRRSADFTLGTGFIAFVAGQKGQLMLLKSGLVPAFRQERVIEANTRPLGGQ